MAGRPKVEIDYEMVKKLAQIQCTISEIASVIGCTERTLYNHPEFKEIYEKGLENGKASLRRIQWKHAEKSASMAIFLGKQYLGQKDVVEQQMDTNNGIMTDLVEALKNVKKD